jgi:hypothetical protein
MMDPGNQNALVPNEIRAKFGLYIVHGVGGVRFDDLEILHLTECLNSRARKQWLPDLPVKHWMVFRDRNAHLAD